MGLRSYRYFNSYSRPTGIDFRRQNLTSTDVRFWRLTAVVVKKKFPSERHSISTRHSVQSIVLPHVNVNFFGILCFFISMLSLYIRVSSDDLSYFIVLYYISGEARWFPIFYLILNRHVG